MTVSKPNPPPRNVFVVDDDPFSRFLAIEVLEAAGFAGKGLEGGMQAIQACQDDPPAAVLMDVNMPQMDGLRVARHLRALQRSGDLPEFPIMAFTSMTDAATIARCLDAGMIWGLVKPLDHRTIRRVLKGHVRKSAR